MKRLVYPGEAMRRLLFYRMRYYCWRLGGGGAIALALLLMAALAWGGLVYPKYKEIADLQTAMLEAPKGIAQTQEADRESELSKYLALLSAEVKPASLIGSFYSLAAKSGLRIDSASLVESDGASSSNGRIGYVVVDIKALGSADSVRQFVNAVWAEMPFSALVEFTFTRAKLADSQLEAQLRFRLFSKRLHKVWPDTAYPHSWRFCCG